MWEPINTLNVLYSSLGCSTATMYRWCVSLSANGVSTQSSDPPKGMKAILQESSLWHHRILLICLDETKCEPTAITCCVTQVLEHQPDFLAQKSLVQETIEAAGHLCILLPKFHCKLNFIEYFWGAMKHYLCEHCNYTYAGLQENLPKALASVDISTIWKWEHRMIRWMEAYGGSKDAKEASLLVKQFSSCRYDSHCQVPETVAS